MASDWWWIARDHGKGTEGRRSPFCPSPFLCQHIFIERETSGYEAVSPGFWEWGCPKRGDAIYQCDTAISHGFWTARRKLERVNFRQDFWWRREKNWPIADWHVPGYDPCGTQFGSSSVLVSAVTNGELRVEALGRVKVTLKMEILNHSSNGLALDKIGWSQIGHIVRFTQRIILLT